MDLCAPNCISSIDSVGWAFKKTETAKWRVEHSCFNNITSVLSNNLCSHLNAFPQQYVTELTTWTRDHLRPPVSGRKVGTEETRKQRPNKQRKPLQEKNFFLFFFSFFLFFLFLFSSYFLLKSSSTPLVRLNFHFHYTITLQKKREKPYFQPELHIYF